MPVTGGYAGGYDDDDSANSVYVYDPQADAWTQLASMSEVRHGHGPRAPAPQQWVARSTSSVGTTTRTV